MIDFFYLWIYIIKMLVVKIVINNKKKVYVEQLWNLLSSVFYKKKRERENWSLNVTVCTVTIITVSAEILLILIESWTFF